MNREIELLNRLLRFVEEEDAEGYLRFRKEASEVRILSDLFFHDAVNLGAGDRIFADDLFMDFLEADTERLSELLSDLIYGASEEEIRRLVRWNESILSGFIVYYAHQYNFFMLSLLTLLLMVYNAEHEYSYQEGLDFMDYQKTEDGEFGYINPLKEYGNIDMPMFYALNRFCARCCECYHAKNIQKERAK